MRYSSTVYGVHASVPSLNPHSTTLNTMHVEKKQHPLDR